MHDENTKTRFALNFSIQFQTFSLVASALKLNYTVVPPQSAVRFSGLVSDVSSGLADFGVSHTFLSAGRAAIMDHTAAVNTDDYCFLVVNQSVNIPFKKSFKMTVSQKVLQITVLRAK